MKRFRMLVVAFLLFALVLPATAAERVESLPEVRPISSARFEIALTLQDQPFIVGSGELQGPDRAHFVLKALPVDNLPESTIEVVVIGNQVYTRVDDDPQWYVEDTADLPVEAPEADVEDVATDVQEAPIYEMGQVEIAGTPTNQYQIWISANDDENPTDHIALDFFIGQAVNYLYQDQTSIFVTEEEVGQIKLVSVVRLFAFDDPAIVVGAPENAIPRPDTTGLIAPLANGGVLSTLNAPLSTSELRALVLQRLGN